MNLYKRSQKLAISALCTALVFGATAAIAVPIPAMNGYINVGDAIIFVTAALFGPLPAFIAGGLGSAFADLALGFAYWALPTLIIKSLEGLAAGLVFSLFKKLTKKHCGNVSTALKALSYPVSFIFASIIMISGYYIATSFLTGSFIVAAAASLIPNLIQCSVSLAIAIPLSVALKKILFRTSDGTHSKTE